MINLIKKRKIYTKIFVGLGFFIIQFSCGTQEYKKSNRQSFLCCQSSGILSLWKKQKVNMPNISFKNYEGTKLKIIEKFENKINNSELYDLYDLNKEYDKNGFYIIDFPSGFGNSEKVLATNNESKKKHILLQKKNIKVWFINYFGVSIEDSPILFEGLSDEEYTIQERLYKLRLIAEDLDNKKLLPNIFKLFKDPNLFFNMHQSMIVFITTLKKNEEYLKKFSKIKRVSFYPKLKLVLNNIEWKIIKNPCIEDNKIFMAIIENIKNFESILDKERLNNSLRRKKLEENRSIEWYEPTINHVFLLIYLKSLQAGVDTLNNILSPEKVMLIASLGNRLDAIAMNLILRFLI